VAVAICYLAGAGFVTGTVLEYAVGANLTVGAVGGVIRATGPVRSSWRL
jgi:hypothetical protein